MSFVSREYKKVKTASKAISSNSNGLSQIIYDTVSEISEIVGSTLGPHGKTVLIERREDGLPPIFTKDGVTVIRSLAYQNVIKQVLLETFRDSAIKTVELAGDGTTTATILAHSITEHMFRFLKDNPKLSPQRVMRDIVSFVNSNLIPLIQTKAIKVTAENSKELLTNVATVSSNGDKELASYILKCFELVGDNGHITLSEDYNSNGYEVSKISGYPISKGWEESLSIFYNEFITDFGDNKIILENPKFILLNGKINDLAPFAAFLETLGQEAMKGGSVNNYVFFATGFSKEFLKDMAALWSKRTYIKVLPVIVPMDIYPNSQFEFLKDVSAYTGAKIFNPINAPLAKGTPADVGKITVPLFECQRYRSVIHASGYPETVLSRVEELEKRQKEDNTKLMQSILTERMGKLTGGIAKLTIKNLSDSAVREIKDRAEDAICAIRGALKHGVLPGGSRTLLDMCLLTDNHESAAIREILGAALKEPFSRLLRNSGLTDEEIIDIGSTLVANSNLVYECVSGKFGDPYELGLFDSAPAVIESLKSAVSIASNLATTSAIIAFDRDDELERQQSAIGYDPGA